MSSFNPLVSIIVPVYNGANYLNEAIDSAIAQTYKNIEIIVVNDGSNDDGATERVALAYGDKIQYYSKPNGGTSTALNLGISHMKGEYFSWLSHDDMYYPNKILRSVETLAQLEDKNTIIMTDLDGINEDYKKIYKTNYIAHIKAYPPRENSYLHPIIYNQTHGCTLLIPRICFDTVGLFDEEKRVAQDFEFFYRAFARYPHKLIPEILVTARDTSTRQGIRSKAQGDVEYSELFINIIESFTDEDIKGLAPSRMDFYIDMRNFFTAAEYSIALKYIEDKFYVNLQISSYDLTGQRFNGHDLHFYLREQGIDSKQLVLYKQSLDESTYVFDFNIQHSVKELLQQKIFLDADIVHLHLVHNIVDINYFPLIAKLKPTVISLHDSYYLGGHCIHHYECEKWKTHCADCQYLDEDFKLYNDFSALNFALKKEAIQNSPISAIVASKWLLDKVEQSPIWKGKKIYYLPFGIDLQKFQAGDGAAAKQQLNIPAGNTVLLFRADTWPLKGFDIIVDALERLRDRQNVTLISVGTKGLLGKLRNEYHTIEYDWLNDESKIVQLFQACDIFLMPSRQEAFGLMAVEAMCCGKMVLALDSVGSAVPQLINSPSCGLAVKEADYAAELARLIPNKFEVLDRGNRCADYARAIYDKERYIKQMINIYDEVISGHRIDDESAFLLEQLKKYANAHSTQYANRETGSMRSVVAKNSVIKKIARCLARGAWNIISFLNLKPFVTSTRMYSKMKSNGLLDKLRG